MDLMIRDGLYAGTVAAFASAIPSTVIVFLKTQSIKGVLSYFDAAAVGVGNVLLPSNYPFWAQASACIVIHLFLSYFLSLLLSYVTSRRPATVSAHIKPCLVAVALAHLLHLIVLPNVINAPWLRAVLAVTGHIPHVADHLGFGVAVAWSLANRKLQVRNISCSLLQFIFYCRGRIQSDKIITSKIDCMQQVK